MNLSFTVGWATWENLRKDKNNKIEYNLGNDRALIFRVINIMKYKEKKHTRVEKI